MLVSLLAACSLLCQRAPPDPPMPADVAPVVTTDSGLKYSVLEKGKEGASPRLGDKVLVHYTGWNADGRAFETTRSQPKPTEFVVGDVIEGFNEALLAMTPGARWKIVIPPQLGWGAIGNPPRIKPNATLVYELELISFERGPELPPFHPGDPAKQKHSESGLVWEPIVEGSGPAPKPGDFLEIRFAYWNEKGRLLGCTEKIGAPLRGRANDFQMRLLQLAPQFLKVGDRLRFQAPAELCVGLPFGLSPTLPKDSTTIWEIELTQIFATFELPDPATSKKTESGIVWQSIKEGDGPAAAAGDQVQVHYIGWLTDGTVFDTTYFKGRPATYSLKPPGLMAGWIEAVPLMKEGGIARFLIPPQLAYAEKQNGKIPPNSTLLFQIELLKVGK
jgi:FKBP-type peptidyl-prolyl cis-trans isomerase